jgi:hypothetical protein
MALIRQQITNTEVIDDQSPTLWESYVGNWTHHTKPGYNNGTITTTSTPGASFTFTFTGTQIVDCWLCCVVLTLRWEQGLRRRSTVAYRTPTQKEISFPGQPSNTKLTGVPVSHSLGMLLSEPLIQCRIVVTSQKPFHDTGGPVGGFVYFQTQKLEDAAHEIDITVKTVSLTDPFILDFLLVTPAAGGSSSGVDTTRSVPSSTITSSSVPIVTASSTPIGAIAGGIVGSIAGIAILSIAVWYILRRRSCRGKAYYFETITSEHTLDGEGP